MIEALCIAGLVRFPQARIAAEKAGGLAALFDGVALDVASEVTGDPLSLPLDADNHAEAIVLLENARDFAPDNADWAVYLVNRIAMERAGVRLVSVLTWGADTLRRGAPAEYVAREIAGAFQAAGITCA